MTPHAGQVDVAGVAADLAAGLAGRPVLAVIAVTLEVLSEAAVVLGDVGRGAGLGGRKSLDARLKARAFLCLAAVSLMDTGLKSSFWGFDGQLALGSTGTIFWDVRIDLWVSIDFRSKLSLE